jgi:hypothetical protein
LTGFDANRSGAFPLSSRRPLGFGRNSLHTGTQAQLDLCVLKFFKIGERGKLDLVVESFNVLNHTNVALLNQFYATESTALAVFATDNRRVFPDNCSSQSILSSAQRGVYGKGELKADFRKGWSGISRQTLKMY